MKELPIVSFEGKEVKPSKYGIYKCPFKCSGHNGYPEKSWKTEGGFIKHTKECPRRPSLVNRQNESKELELEVFNGYKQKILSELPYKEGDKIIYVKKIVVKPTHEWRGNRSVRVRYEEVLRFEACEESFRSADLIYNGGMPNYEDLKRNKILINGHIRQMDICDTMETAKDTAKKKTDADEKHREFSSMCR